MTLDELIDALNTLSNSAYGDTRVVVEGYEGGFEDIEALKIMDLLIDYTDTSYYGPHWPAWRARDECPDSDTERAIAIIGRDE